jgi:hypothetical protein
MKAPTLLHSEVQSPHSTRNNLIAELWDQFADAAAARRNWYPIGIKLFTVIAAKIVIVAGTRYFGPIMVAFGVLRVLFLEQDALEVVLLSAKQLAYMLAVMALPCAAAIALLSLILATRIATSWLISRQVQARPERSRRWAKEARLWTREIPFELPWVHDYLVTLGKTSAWHADDLFDDPVSPATTLAPYGQARAVVLAHHLVLALDRAELQRVADRGIPFMRGAAACSSPADAFSTAASALSQAAYAETPSDRASLRSHARAALNGWLTEMHEASAQDPAHAPLRAAAQHWLQFIDAHDRSA